jgi:fructose/tagatose bisphosphate aldolase
MNFNKYKYCFSPISKEFVDAVIEYSNNNNTPFIFIPTRRQIEYNGGYVNDWDSNKFCKYVKKNSKYILLERDHGGPNQGYGEDDGILSLTDDCKYYDIIHIDPWVKTKKYSEGLKYTIDLINHCYSINNNLYFEVGTEEKIRKFEVNELDKFLSDLKENLKKEVFDKIIYVVVQGGTILHDNKNLGTTNDNRLNDMVNIIKKYNKYSKEHNGDFLENNIIQNKFNIGLDAINIGPEFANLQTKVILEELKNSPIIFNKIYELCYMSKKWVKWVDDNFIPEENKEKLILISCHYIYSNDEFRKMIHDKLDNIKRQYNKIIFNKLNVIQNNI